MTPDEVASTYNAIAAHWDSPEFNRANGIAQHERALRFAAKAESALDVGCGSSGRIVELLLARQFEVEKGTAGPMDRRSICVDGDHLGDLGGLPFGCSVTG